MNVQVYYYSLPDSSYFVFVLFNQCKMYTHIIFLYYIIIIIYFSRLVFIAHWLYYVINGYIFYIIKI